MAQSNSGKILDTMFYEADTAYIGSRSESEHCQGCATEWQQKRRIPFPTFLYYLLHKTQILKVF